MREAEEYIGGGVRHRLELAAVKGPARLAALVRGRRGRALLAVGVALATVIVIGAVALASRTASPSGDSVTAALRGCPSALLVSETLNQTIKKATAAVFSFGAGPTRGSKLTCSYTTNRGATIDYELSSNVNPYAIAAAEQAGSAPASPSAGEPDSSTQRRSPS